MSSKTKFDVIRPLIDEAFENGEAFVFKPNGTSMLPCIKGGKTVVKIEEYKGNAKKFDVIFYQRDDGKYVMHRVVKKFSDCYGVCGDNQWWIEKVYDKQIFAIMTEIDAKSDRGGFFYLHTLWLRRFIIHVIAYLKKHLGDKGK